MYIYKKIWLINGFPVISKKIFSSSASDVFPTRAALHWNNWELLIFQLSSSGWNLSLLSCYKLPDGTYHFASVIVNVAPAGAFIAGLSPLYISCCHICQNTIFRPSHI